MEHKSAGGDIGVGVFYTQDLVSRSGQLQKLISIAKLIVSKILPLNDQKSLPLFTLLVELIATSVLDPIVQKLSDPLFVNTLILGYMDKLTNINDSLIMNEGESSKSLLQLSSLLRGVI